MCLAPISIINPNKYISLKYRDLYLLQVPCGHCAECQKRKSSEWQYRSYYEFLDCLKYNNSQRTNFVYFDTLTYDNQHLPTIGKRFDVDSDYLCFSRDDIQRFMKVLRQQAIRKYGVYLRYFVSSEYGMHPSDGVTYRPHYHVLFFVYGSISPRDFSELVSKSWSNGRTDGYPYRSSKYVNEHNTIRTTSLANILRVNQYVTKYIQKSTKLTTELNRRIESAMQRYAVDLDPDHPESWLSSGNAQRLRRKMWSLVNQFHLQSLHYGESALSELDIDQLINDGYLIMPHHQHLKVKIAIPTYYKRKIFYRMVEINGAKSWQLNELGVEYCNKREKKLIDDLASRLKCVCIQHHLNYDCKSLAQYVITQRGRFKFGNEVSTIEQRLQSLDYYNYSTITDKEELGHRGLSHRYLGNSVQGYQHGENALISFKAFIDKYVCLDENKEKELSHIYYLLSFINDGKQRAFDLKQRLENVWKVIA